MVLAGHSIGQPERFSAGYTNGLAMTAEFLLYGILVVAGLGSAALVGVAGIALFRRRSLSYFLVTMAIGTLLLRSFVGAVTIGGLIPPETHHLLEHGLDAVVIVLLFTAVYAARRIDPQPRAEQKYQSR